MAHGGRARRRHAVRGNGDEVPGRARRRRDAARRPAEPRDVVLAGARDAGQAGQGRVARRAGIGHSRGGGGDEMKEHRFIAAVLALTLALAGAAIGCGSDNGGSSSSAGATSTVLVKPPKDLKPMAKLGSGE